jgi:hypothetical protein
MLLGRANEVIIGRTALLAGKRNEKELHRVIKWVDFSPIFESPAAFVVVAVGMWATRLRCPSCPQRCLSYGHDLIEGGAALLIAISMTDEGPMESCDATIALAACR